MAATLARGTLAAVFASAALLKGWQFDLEAAQLADLFHLSESRAGYLLVAVVLIELMLAVVLLTHRHGSAASPRVYLSVLILLAAFSGAIAISIVQGRSDCGCFGQAVSIPPVVSLLKNAALAALAAWVYHDARHRASSGPLPSAQCAADF